MVLPAFHTMAGAAEVRPTEAASTSSNSFMVVSKFFMSVGPVVPVCSAILDLDSRVL